jgi:ribosomal protein S18 acetylase RimI-like enzyme
MGDLSFAIARAQDLPELEAIRARAYAPIFASFRALVGELGGVTFATADAEQAELLASLVGTQGPDAELWLVRRSGRTAGFGALAFHRRRRTGEIGLNAVDPEHANHGVGTSLYRHLMDRMRAEGMAVAEVGTGGDASHAPARRAYEKAGFDRAIPSVALYCRL